MNKLLIGALAALTATGVFARDDAGASPRASAQAMADQAQMDASYAKYRRVVLWDTSVALPARPVTYTRWEAGPYTRYLMLNGATRDQAVAQAQVLGEEPRFAIAAPRQPELLLSHYELYRRVVLGTPVSEIVGRPVAEPTFAGLDTYVTTR